MKSLTVVILGGTGDLAKKKLIPAILNLKKRNVVDKIDIIATGRKNYSQSDFIKHLGLEESFKDLEVEINYFKADFTKEDSLAELSGMFKKMEDRNLIGRIFYLATSPEFFSSISSQIAKLALSEDKNIFNRIMIEKPFGYDLKSSNEINDTFKRYFPERDIFRVDHYLGKETIQNILVLRLSNPFFERTWNSDFIDKIEITVSEDIGVADRIGYYDGAGAIRDMIQNHLLQIATFILMEPPASISGADIHQSKSEVIRKLRFTGESLIGQYDGYAREYIAKGLGERTVTETYARINLIIDSARWKGTKIVLKTGKNLDKRFAKIEIDYKKEPCILYCDINTYPNKLILNVQPKQDIDFLINIKTPGRSMNVKQIKLSFGDEGEFRSNTPENYEVILEECVRADNTLFISNCELEESWKLIDDIKAAIGTAKPLIYAKGSKGPE